MTNMPEIEIPRLVREVETGDIRIPEFQREFVWSNDKVRDLVESIYKELPIGLITLYRIPKEEREKEGLFWVLDGQQRLLSLTLIFNGLINLRRGTKELWIWFEPSKEEFTFTEGATPIKPRKPGDWILLPNLLKIENREDFEKAISTEEASRKIKLGTLWGRFRHDYKVLFHEVSTDDPDILGDIFVRTNFAGTKVKGSDVYSTWVAIRAPGVVRDLREFTEELGTKLGQKWDIDYSILIRTFIAFLTDGKVKLASRVLDQAEKLSEDLKKMGAESIRELSEKVKQKTGEVIDLLAGPELMINSSDFLPTQNVLVTMAYYLNKRGKLSEDERKGLLAWFVLASHFGRYSSSVETRLNEDLSVIKGGGDYRGLVSELEKRTGDIRFRLREEITDGEWSELLLYAILKLNGAKDLITNDDLSAINVHTHHIFPRATVAGFGDLVWDVGNITFVSGNTNVSLSSKKPEEYLPLVPAEIRKGHAIPENQELWKSANFQEFLKVRRELLIDATEKFLVSL